MWHEKWSGDTTEGPVMKSQKNISHDQREEPDVKHTHAETCRTVLVMIHFAKLVLGCKSPGIGDSTAERLICASRDASG